MTIKINVLIVKNSFLTKTEDAKTSYKTQHTSQHVRKTNKYIKSLKCLLASTCFVFLFNSTNTHTHTHTHMYVYMYIYVCVSFFLYKCVSG